MKLRLDFFTSHSSPLPTKMPPSFFSIKCYYIFKHDLACNYSRHLADVFPYIYYFYFLFFFYKDFLDSNSRMFVNDLVNLEDWMGEESGSFLKWPVVQFLFLPSFFIHKRSEQSKFSIEIYGSFSMLNSLLYLLLAYTSERIHRSHIPTVQSHPAVLISKHLFTAGAKML